MDSEDEEPDFPSVSLTDLQIPIQNVVLPERAAEFIRDGRQRFKSVNCFDFVPSNYENAWSVLDQIARGSFCEWGSGLGITVGLAEILGYEACGIELDSGLAELSREFLRDHGLKAMIKTGSYYDDCPVADVYYVYCWPGQTENVERRFVEIAPPSGRLLICYGQDDLRCMVQQR